MSGETVNILKTFSGRDGSLGFEKGRLYLLSTWIDNNYIWIEDDRGQQCPYESIKSFLDNWY